MTSQPPRQGVYWRSEGVGMCVSITKHTSLVCEALRSADHLCVQMNKLQLRTYTKWGIITYAALFKLYYLLSE